MPRCQLALKPVALTLLLLMLLVGLGCERQPAGPATQPGRNPAGASVADLVPDANAAPVRPVALVAPVAPATRPTAPLPEGASCVTPACHATFATAKHIHGPVSVGACSACHQNDTGGHVYPLKRQGVQTCTFCHAVSGTQAHQHAAIAKQGCTACHKPHSSEAKFLLTSETVEGVCAQCHDLPLKPHAHRPFAAGQCTLCHQPHQSQAKALLRGGDGPEHCYSCHGEIRQAINSSAYVHPPAKEACTTCHGPHATDAPHQLVKPLNETCFSCHKDIQQRVRQAKVPHQALLTGDGCANCHDPHAAGRADLLPQRMDKLCLKCHDKVLTASDGHTVASMKPALTAANLHGPIRAADCTACHDVHGADFANLLRKPFPKAFYASFDLGSYQLCFGCHDQQLVLAQQTSHLTNFRNGDTNLHYAHVHREDKGRTCKTCHAIHGSDLPNHMAGEVPFEGSKWAMPIRYEKTADGGRCAPGCHGPRAYSREPRQEPAEQRQQPTTEPAPSESVTRDD